MIRKTISMPDRMGEFIADRIKSGDYQNESEYIRDLIRRDQKSAWAKAELQRMYKEAIDSGYSDSTVDEIFEEALARVASEKDV